jgi:phosphate transport system substrate-binding protein
MKLKGFILTLALTASLFYLPSASANTELKSGGSTFSSNYIDRCRVIYAQQGGGILNYTANGSGAGRNFFNNKLIDFAVTDTPYGSSDAKPKEEYMYLPLLAGPVAVVYNLPEYKVRLKLSKEVLAKIFAGQITMWNDPQIAKLNIGKLPNKRIVVVFRSDGSGTSEVFTSYLNAVAPKIWTKPGSKTFTSAFPGNINKFTGYFQSSNGAMQVAITGKMMPGTITYNEVSYVGTLKSALIENESGRFIAPTTLAASAFLSGLKFNTDGSASLDYLNKSKSSYNISTFAYALVYKNNGERAAGIKKFLEFALTKCNKIPNYAPITGNALKVAKTQLAKLN